MMINPRHFTRTMVATSLLAFGLALGFGLPAELAVGLMLLAASPGGATANIYSHLARGDVALNITLTAINSVICLLTLPLILNLSLEYFLGAGQFVPPPIKKVVEVAVIIILPVLIGMLIRARAPGFATRAEKPPNSKRRNCTSAGMPRASSQPTRISRAMIRRVT